MAVCNIFSNLANNTGTFLTFSQYMEDLTQWTVRGSSYRVIPSKYVAVELDTEANHFDNYTLTKYLADAFENGCAQFREGDWKQYNSAELFWDALFTKNLLSSTEGVVNGIKYVGDINLQSYNEHDGMGYAEIYCHIPNEAPRTSYSLISSPDEESVNFISRYAYAGDLLCGYMENELNGKEKIAYDYTYRISSDDRLYTFNWDDKTNPPKELPDASFDINAVIVLYKVVDVNGNIIHHDIPMGMYITGTIDENGKITNTIKKFVSNGDIYNTGTSYGLRICSRYMVSPQTDNYIIKSVTTEDNNYADLSRVLAEISTSHQKMDEILTHNYRKDQNFKEVLSIFKNNRTNVPYIKTINGVNYWFVNGRMINTATDSGDNCDAYTDTELDSLMGINQSLVVQLFARDIFGQSVINKLNGGPTNIRMEWKVMYGGRVVDADEVVLEVNGKSIPVSTTASIADVFIREDSTFKITCSYKNMEASASTVIKYVYPTYIGAIDDSSQIRELPQYLKADYNDLVKSSFGVTANNQYLCVAYPKDFGELEFITDNSGYVLYTKSCEDVHLGDHVNDFEKTIKTIGGVEYYAYILKNGITLTGDYKLKFS